MGRTYMSVQKEGNPQSKEDQHAFEPLFGCCQADYSPLLWKEENEDTDEEEEEEDDDKEAGGVEEDDGKERRREGRRRNKRGRRKEKKEEDKREEEDEYNGEDDDDDDKEEEYILYAVRAGLLPYLCGLLYSLCPPVTLIKTHGVQLQTRCLIGPWSY